MFTLDELDLIRRLAESQFHGEVGEEFWRDECDSLAEKAVALMGEQQAERREREGLHYRLVSLSILIGQIDRDLGRMGPFDSPQGPTREDLTQRRIGLQVEYDKLAQRLGFEPGEESS